MTMQTVSLNKAYGGIQGVYRHASEETRTEMTFSVYVPPHADGEAHQQDGEEDGAEHGHRGAIGLARPTREHQVHAHAEGHDAPGQVRQAPFQPAGARTHGRPPGGRQW